MSPESRITELTRRRIIDRLILGNVNWAGRLDEDAFLARIYDLDGMESGDPRFDTARGDIWQHRVLNPYDWPDDWIFQDQRFGLQQGGPDEAFLKFLSEMLHPVVRSDRDEVEQLRTEFNEALAPDGYEIVQSGSISGHPLYEGRSRNSFHGTLPQLKLEQRPLLTDHRVLQEHLARIRDGVDRDPAAAIASCKELVESLCKIILDRSGVEYPAHDDVPQLYRKVSELLALKAESVPASAKGSETAQKILRTLSTTVQCLAELRNQLGLGHGRTTSSPALARHARLALNSTVTITEFLLDTWQERVDKGTLKVAS
ncbi:hypothetical protein SHKM778_87280 [Streptomyces sp. KM77-8]|uniref:Abortive infection protein-like C-terminal domain-containing protein n=1 Tax=Streptomyces haneummycinicus TaxID=3074435 RepID=A0AAT9HYN7_9ACTN